MKHVEHKGPTPWRTGDVAEPVLYSRTRRTGDEQKGRTRIFRGNRGLMITLIDIVVVTLLFIIFYTLLLPLSESVTIQPYRMKIDHVVNEDTVDIFVVIHHRPPGIFSSASSPSSVQPALPGQPIVTLRVDDVSVADLAPREGEQRQIILTVPIPQAETGDSDGEALDLVLEIGGEERNHRINLR